MPKKPYNKLAGNASIPNSLFYENLPPTEKLLLLALKKFAFGKKTVCNPSIAGLAEIVKISTRQVSTLLKNLETKKHITREKGYRNGKIYRLTNLRPMKPVSSPTHEADFSTEAHFLSDMKPTSSEYYKRRSSELFGRRVVTAADVETFLHCFKDKHQAASGTTYLVTPQDTAATQNALAVCDLNTAITYLDTVFNSAPGIPNLADVCCHIEMQMTRSLVR